MPKLLGHRLVRKKPKPKRRLWELTGSTHSNFFLSWISCSLQTYSSDSSWKCSLRVSTWESAWRKYKQTQTQTTGIIKSDSVRVRVKDKLMMLMIQCNQRARDLNPISKLCERCLSATNMFQETLTHSYSSSFWLNYVKSGYAYCKKR